MANILKENLIYAVYYAPRGRKRMYSLARDLSQRHLYPSDLLIGVIGAEGAGKSMLIRGLFPGLELTNDDAGVNNRSTPLYEFDESDFFAPHTFHIDVRYEAAFHQMFEIAEAVKKAIDAERRVVVEHFDLLYPYLKMNGSILFGVGEEVIVTRPTYFGPYPLAIKRIVDSTLIFRQMAHSAEDLVSLVLDREYGFQRPVLHSDVKHGFVINFTEKPSIDIQELKTRVFELIDQDLPISYVDENHLSIGDMVMVCTGPRVHVKSTGKIKNLRFVSDYKINHQTKEYMLIGSVGETHVAGFEDILPRIEEVTEEVLVGKNKFDPMLASQIGTLEP